MRSLVKIYCNIRVFDFFKNELFVWHKQFRKLWRWWFYNEELPNKMIIQITNRCDVRCEFCYAANEIVEGKKHLSDDDIYAMIETADMLGCTYVVLTGGETTVHPHLIDFVRAIRKHKMMPFVGSNGVYVTKEVLSALKEAGVSAMNFNVPALGSKHDKIMKVHGAHEKAIENVKHAANIGIRSFINFVATHEAIRSGDVEKIIALAKRIGCKGVLLFDPCLCSSNDEILLSNEERAIVDAYDEDPFIRRDIKNFAGPNRCPIGVDLMINVYGEVLACQFIPVQFGSIYEEPVVDILKRMRIHPICKNRNYPHCRAGRDMWLIDNYCKQAHESGQLPTSWLHFEK